MNNDTELVEFYKFLSERAIIDDCCRGEGEAECAVKLYNKSKVKNLDIQRVSNNEVAVCRCKKPKRYIYGVRECEKCGKPLPKAN
jgi:hypothetical protein